MNKARENKIMSIKFSKFACCVSVGINIINNIIIIGRKTKKL